LLNLRTTVRTLPSSDPRLGPWLALSLLRHVLLREDFL